MKEQQSAIDAELARFQGAWKTVAIELDGSLLPPYQYEQARLVIEGDRFMLCNRLPDAEQRLAGSFQVDPTKTPQELDLHLDNGQVFQEIYELEGDTLRVCYPVQGGARPIALKAAPGTDLSLVTYRRE